MANENSRVRNSKLDYLKVNLFYYDWKSNYHNDCKLTSNSATVQDGIVFTFSGGSILNGIKKKRFLNY